MLKAKDIMTRDPITATPEMEIAQAAQLLLEKGINGLPVVEESGKVVGILCQSDLIMQQKKLPIPSIFTTLDGFIPLTSMKHIDEEVQKMTGATVARTMTKKVVTIRPDLGIDEIATLMVEKSYHTLPVVDEGKLVGIVGKEDVLKTLISGAEKE